MLAVRGSYRSLRGCFSAAARPRLSGPSLPLRWTPRSIAASNAPAAAPVRPVEMAPLLPLGVVPISTKRVSTLCFGSSLALFVPYTALCKPVAWCKPYPALPYLLRRRVGSRTLSVLAIHTVTPAHERGHSPAKTGSRGNCSCIQKSTPRRRNGSNRNQPIGRLSPERPPQ